MNNKSTTPLIKIKSLINNDTYFTSKNFPSKYIDGKEFIGVKRTENDKKIFFMLKENVKICSNE